MNISFVITLILQCAFFFSYKDDNALVVVNTHFQDLRSRFASHYEDVYDSVWTSARHSTYRVFGPPPPSVTILEVIKGESLEDIRDRLQGTNIVIRIIEPPEEYSPAPDCSMAHATAPEAPTIDNPLPEPSFIFAPPSEVLSIDAPLPQAPAGDASTGKRLSYLLPYICLSVMLAVQPLAFLFGYLNDPSRCESLRTTGNGRESRRSRSRPGEYSSGSAAQADLVVDSDEAARQFLAFMKQCNLSLSTKPQYHKFFDQHAIMSTEMVAMHTVPSQRYTDVATRDVSKKAYYREHSSPNRALSSRGQEDWRSKTVSDKAFDVSAAPPSYMSAAGSARELDGKGISPSPKATGSGLVPRRFIDTPMPPRVRFGRNVYIQDGSESQGNSYGTTDPVSRKTCAEDRDVFAENAGREILKVVDTKTGDTVSEESLRLVKRALAMRSSTRVGPDSSPQKETPRPPRIQRDVFYTIPKKAIEVQPRERKGGRDARDAVRSGRGTLNRNVDSVRQASHGDGPAFRILSRPGLLRISERVYHNLPESPLASKSYSAVPSMLGQEPRKESKLVPRLAEEKITEKRRGDEDGQDAVHDVYSRSATSRRRHMDENDGRQRDSAPIDERLQAGTFSRDRSGPRTSRNGRTDEMQRVSHERRRVGLTRRNRHHEAPTVCSMGPAREPAHGVFRTSKRRPPFSPVKPREPEPSCRCPGGDPFCYERANTEWFHSTPIRSLRHGRLCRDMEMTETVKRIEKPWLQSDFDLYNSSHFMRDGRPRFKLV
ncbi:hypothetical protein ACEPAF_1050 [Sanghuangporus sanghuang]